MACKPQTNGTPAGTDALPETKEHQQWAQAMNTEPLDIASLYYPEGIKVDADGQVFRGSDTIETALQNFGQVIDSVYTIKTVAVGNTGRYEYEIGGFITSEGKPYRHLLVMRKDGEKKVRELEFIAAVVHTTTTTDALDTFRDQWITRCNAHDAYGLVSKSYTPNAIYYNNKSVIIGTDAIAEKYAYMNRESYNLQLTPISVEMVSDSLALEIGQCSGSYGGKYVLVWQKNEAGEWQVLLDSNV